VAPSDPRDSSGVPSAPGTPSTYPPRRPSDEKSAESEDRHFNTTEILVGTGMMFIGFLNVLLSISGGYEISVFPIILYFGGLAIWAHAKIVHPTVRYAVITASIAAALGFFHYGEVHFWHKQLIFWGTIAMVGFFMFTSAKQPK